MPAMGADEMCGWAATNTNQRHQGRAEHTGRSAGTSLATASAPTASTAAAGGHADDVDSRRAEQATGLQRYLVGTVPYNELNESCQQALCRVGS